MKRASLFLLVAVALALPRAAHATIACELKVPRCARGFCSDPTMGPEESLNGMAAGSHKSPVHPGCPSGGPYGTTCTNDFFAWGSFDSDSYTSDYVYVWYAANPVDANHSALVSIYDDSLQRLMYSNDWNAISSISYVDIDLAWSTYNDQYLLLNFGDASGHAADLRDSTVLIDGQSYSYTFHDNAPDGTHVYKRMTGDPTTPGVAWTKSKFSAWRMWSIVTRGPIDAAHPGGVFIQSITETVGFQFNGTACPVLATIVN